MGIKLVSSKVQRDWGEISTDATETALQTLTLGSDGFSGAISAFLRAAQGLRGEDTTETRATRLVMETLGYATAATIASSRLGQKPEKKDIQLINQSVMERASELILRENVSLETEHLDNPQSLRVFED